jgi:hypothetical protein
MIFRTSPSLLALLLILPCCLAESSVQTHTTADPARVTTGQAVMIVNGPWRFHMGDDPRWADPGFDDSTWETYTIDSAHAPLTLSKAVEGAQLRGWQAHGHPGYVGYAWYRISVDPASDRGALAILMPKYVDDAYQIYLNGQQIGAFGQFQGHHLAYTSQPQLFPIPAGIIPAAGPFTLALRFRNSTFEGLPTASKQYGGLRGVPLLGAAQLLAICYEAERGQISTQFRSEVMRALLWGAVALISLFLFFSTRTHREYLWAGISFCGFALMMASLDLGRLAPLPIPIMISGWIIGSWIGLSTGPIVAMYMLGVHKPLWRCLNYISITALATGDAILLGLYLSLLPPTSFWDSASWIQTYANCGVAFLVLAIAVDGVRTIRSRAWMLLTPGLFGAFGLLAEIAGPRFSTLSTILETLVPVALLIVFLLRAAQQHRENEQYILDMRQAQEVQQILLPDHLPQVAGFSVESVYMPAREVGGDFFQVLETQTGSLLIVFGDIAGKGLPAAMLVAMLVGAIRTRAKETGDPGEILSALNDRLCGNTRGGFATCIAAHISVDGTVDLANAGHLAPYLNGKEIDLEGALPLGVVPDIEFATTRFLLEPGDGLTFVSDGVVEATNSRKELFGFDRLRKISTEEAQRIADAAKRFGQEDDITVLTFRRLSVPIETRVEATVRPAAFQQVRKVDV